jgi:hypothetical protein
VERVRLTPYEICIPNIANLEEDLTLNLYSIGFFKNRLVASKVIRVRQIEQSSGFIRGQMEFKDEKIRDGKFKLILATSRKTILGQSAKFSLKRLLEQPAGRSLEGDIEDVKVDVLGTFGEKNGITVKIDWVKPHHFKVVLVNALTGKRVGRVVNVEPHANIATLDVPEVTGKYYVEVYVSRWFRPRTLVYRSRLQDINAVTFVSKQIIGHAGRFVGQAGRMVGGGVGNIAGAVGGFTGKRF